MTQIFLWPFLNASKNFKSIHKSFIQPSYHIVRMVNSDFLKGNSTQQSLQAQGKGILQETASSICVTLAK